MYVGPKCALELRQPERNLLLEKLNSDFIGVGKASIESVGENSI